MKNLLFLFSLCVVLISCEEKVPATPKDLSKEYLIPKPNSLTATGSSFRVDQNTRIIVQDGNKELERMGKYLSEQLSPATGFKFPISPYSDLKNGKNTIYISAGGANEKITKEGYKLEISETAIQLRGDGIEGVFRGVQTLLQLFPESILKKELAEGPWEIASGTITDSPNYEYRGAMLDVSRHFFGVEAVKEFIDHIARYKMNYLHLHLTDDQGWRIEIKKWPELTKIGGSTEVGGGKGGFFTQEEYKEIVQYAADRFITVVPEIDMPGHTNAALASYAELNCDGKARELYTGMEVGFSTLCTRNENTYEFIDDVIKEIVTLTPGPYIHIGGDESHSTKEEDYIYFIDRVQDIVTKHGKQMMGWDDITAGSLKSNAIAQHWAKKENAQKAVKQNVKILMSPANKTYLDMKYDSTTTLGLKWAGYIEVDTGYIWDPTTLIEGVGRENIIGVECPLWTETVTNLDELEYLVFPRLLGYAEIGWSKQEDRNWEDYKNRLANHQARLEALDIKYYPSALVPWVKPTKKGLEMKN